MDVLIWRQWVPRYSHPLVFSALEQHGMGGTETQLLWHARVLAEAGHRVQVLGASREDLVEEQVDFVGAQDRNAQEAAANKGRLRTPDLVLLEGSPDGAQWFRRCYPTAAIVHVGQNIDAGGHKRAFAEEPHIDLYAFVSPGHFAEYCVRFAHLRHKFALLRNCVPWHRLYYGIVTQPIRNHVVWVGSWWKKGLRQWAETMERIMHERPEVRWTLCGPSYGSPTGQTPPDIFAGLHLPKDRVRLRTLPLAQLAAELGSAQVALVSLGNETAGISVLDAHAMGRPAISGNDIVYKHNNPDGVGIRVTTRRECYQALNFLLDRPELCNRLGSLGRELVLDEYTEHSQEKDLRRILQQLPLRRELGPHALYRGTSYLEDRVRDLQDKVLRKWHQRIVSGVNRTQQQGPNHQS